MTGNNTIVINKATMIEAIRFWLDKEVLQDSDIKVTDVTANGDVFNIEIHSQVTGSEKP